MPMACQEHLKELKNRINLSLSLVELEYPEKNHYIGSTCLGSLGGMPVNSIAAAVAAIFDTTLPMLNSLTKAKANKTRC